MATITHVPTDIKTFGDHATLILWETLVNTDDGSTVEAPGSSIRSIQIVGTFDTTTIVIEGSNDGTNFVTLEDVENNAMSYTAAAFASPRDVPRFIRPRITADGGSGDLDVHMLIGRPY